MKPSKYGEDGYVERFWRGFMPNATLPYIYSMVPEWLGDTRIRVTSIDEYVQGDTSYLELLDAAHHGPTLLLLVGTQSHQFQRSLDLAALAKSRGAMAVIGGPHPMTCDTTEHQGQGVSFSLAEAETVLPTILADAARGELQSVYGLGQRWAKNLDEAPVLKMPNEAELKRHLVRFVGVYPSRGCPFVCDFCAVIKTAGRNIRSQPIETTMATLRAARDIGVKVVFFTSDNFNKIPNVRELCEAIIEENLGLRFFIQCDTQIVSQPELLELFARAGIRQIFLGVESLSQAALKEVHKMQNKPAKYQQIKEMCQRVGINTHFSMINGFLSDTRKSAREQLQALCDIDPSMASFYTLCPIPGTDQYADFMRKGLIRARNLDRFDTICPTWEHPNLSWDDLRSIFAQCYREFYSLRHVMRYSPHGNMFAKRMMWGFTLFAQWCAARGEHPMSGGVLRRRVDHVSEYLPLREKTYGYELVPLPTNLALSPAEQRYNDTAKIKVPA